MKLKSISSPLRNIAQNEIISNASTVRISELDTDSSQLSVNDIIEYSKYDNETDSYHSKRTNLERIANWIGKLFSFSGDGGLQTNNKTVVGAINELKNSASGESIEDGAGPHNCRFGNRWLGIAPTEAQLTAIANGSFHVINDEDFDKYGSSYHLMVGDYWSDSDPNDYTIENPNAIKYRIVCFDYYLKTGRVYNDQDEFMPLNTHHAVIMPDSSLDGYNYYYNHNGNLSHSFYYSNGSYAKSQMRGYKYDSKEVSTDGTSYYVVKIPEYSDLTQEEIFIWDLPSNVTGRYLGEGEGKIELSAKYGYNLPSSLIIYTKILSDNEADFPKELLDHEDVGVGGLVFAKHIIQQKFTTSHILNFYIKMTSGDEASAHHILDDVPLYNTVVHPFTGDMPNNYCKFSIELPLEEQIYGSSYSNNFFIFHSFYTQNGNIYTPNEDNPNNFIYTNFNTQFPAFQLAPDLKYNHEKYWLQNTPNMGYFAYVNSDGQIIFGFANTPYAKVRPIFCLYKGNGPAPWHKPQ